MYEIALRSVMRNCLAKVSAPTWRMYSGNVMPPSQHETCSSRKGRLHKAFSESPRKALHASCMAKKSPKKPVDPVAKEMARRIKEYREARNWTQEELARATGWTQDDDDNGASKGLSPSRIGNYEQGTRRLGVEEAEILCAVFGPPSGYFLTVLDEHEAMVLTVVRQQKPRRKAG
jgi:transcriptional regulator with XRE-family HTH domain